MKFNTSSPAAFSFARINNARHGVQCCPASSPLRIDGLCAFLLLFSVRLVLRFSGDLPLNISWYRRILFFISRHPPSIMGQDAAAPA